MKTEEPKPKRALPAHLAKYKFVKGQPRPAKRIVPTAAAVQASAPPETKKTFWQLFCEA